MKKKIILIAALTVILGGGAVWFAPRHLSAQTNTPSTEMTNDITAKDAKPKPYPFDTCLVDGMKLGSMGEPYVFVYQGQEIKFCCNGCKPDFLKDPAKYVKKIQDAEAVSKG
jgi:YHS domain-containing protein